MRTFVALTTLLAVLCLANPLLAQPRTANRSSGVGLGVEAMIAGPVGPAFVYDSGMWHLDLIIGVDSNGGTDIGVGGRFFYALHQSDFSDFSVGGGLGLVNLDQGPADDATIFNIEVGAKIRAFIVTNVAINAAAGLVIFAGDDDGFAITGQRVASAGITYFFW